jgi:large subunit ribosomal protein L6
MSRSAGKFCLQFGKKYMSRLAKKPTTIPAGIDVSINGKTLTVKGPKGELSRDFDMSTIGIEIAGNEINFTKKKETPFSRALWGTYASHVRNMIQGVTEPYTKKLILEGIGFKCEVKGDSVEMALGFSHPVSVKIPAGLTVTNEKNNLIVTGINKEQVGAFTADIRSLKKPEPYKGKGFRYDGEVIRRKDGKKSA